MLYNIRQIDQKYDLEEIVKEHKQNKNYFDVAEDSLDESKVMEEYKCAIIAFRKRCIDLPEFPCMSCNKLCFRRECVKIDCCMKPVAGENWQKLLDYIDSHPGYDDGLSDGFVCNYCIGKNSAKAFFQQGVF